jgi:hypothetical protein
LKGSQTIGGATHRHDTYNPSMTPQEMEGRIEQCEIALNEIVNEIWAIAFNNEGKKMIEKVSLMPTFNIALRALHKKQEHSIM